MSVLIDAVQFRKDFPEFDTTAVTDPTAVQVSDSQITYWLNIASLMLTGDTAANNVGSARWGNMLANGMELFAAHNLVLEVRAKQTQATGGIPGASAGMVSAMNAGDVSISYDTGSAMEKDAGHWNLSEYGQRFWRLADMIGSGPLQVGGASPMLFPPPGFLSVWPQ